MQFHAYEKLGRGPRAASLRRVACETDMSKILIRPSWTFSSDTGETVDPQLFRLLRAIHDAGKLTEASRQARLSYRYSWDLLAKWGRFFGTPVVKMERGKGAALTALGAKLLWAEQRSGASLFPQLENIASELNLEIRRATKESQTVLRIHASYGYAVEKLPALLGSQGHANVDIQYMASVAALASLSRADCELAGFHVPEGDLGVTLWEHYEKWLKPRQQRIIRLVTRTQGLIVPRGNPRRVASLQDLRQPGVRFVNRQSGSGTRILLDGLLQRNSIDPRQISGYDSGEFTHAAVAAFVASGMADIGFGIEPAARQFRLDFVPIIQERYMLACHKDSLRLAPVRELIALVQQPAFREQIMLVPGYRPDEPGQVATLHEIFPWTRA
jgi:molybdate transport repressor ModE-like protein